MPPNVDSRYLSGCEQVLRGFEGGLTRCPRAGAAPG